MFTLSFDLAVHSGAHLHQLHDPSLSLANGTLFHILTTLSRTGGAQPGSFVMQGHCSAIIHLFEGELECPLGGLHFRFLVLLFLFPVGMSSEHHIEQSALCGLALSHVIHFAFLWIREHIIGLFELFHLATLISTNSSLGSSPPAECFSSNASYLWVISWGGASGLQSRS